MKKYPSDFKQVADRRGAPDAMAAIAANPLGTSSGNFGSQTWSASAMKRSFLVRCQRYRICQRRTHRGVTGGLPSPTTTRLCRPP